MMNTNSYCIFVTICFANCITALPIGTEVHVHGHTFPKIERIIVHVQKRMADIWDFWQLNRNICPPSLCMFSDDSGVPRRPRGTGGSVFYNGDIVLDSSNEKYIFGDNEVSYRKKRSAVRTQNKLWPYGILKYKWASNIDKKSKRVIRKAMQHIANNTCIRFQKAKNKDENYVRFISEPGCWSNIGHVGNGEQKLSIGRGCNEVVGVAVHELLHALGFWHEQSRPDRDDYVEVLMENVAARYKKDFEKLNKTLVNSRGYPYDYLSIMHYKEFTFTNTGDETIKVKGIGKKLRMPIGQRTAMSNIDIAQLNDMYHCNKKQDANETVCLPGWTKFQRSCYNFIKRPKYQFAAAVKYCREFNSYLAQIDNKYEDKFLQKYVVKKYPNTLRWRLGGRKINDTFYWINEHNEPIEIHYSNWAEGHPAKYTSMVLRKHNKTAEAISWQGAWTGSFNNFPKNAYAFICERPAKRKCIPGNHSDGREYRDTLAHTFSGITCQKWNLQYPHQHKVIPKGSLQTDPDGLGEHNYCRNPSKLRRNRPWCYTTKSKIEWEYCDIHICSKPVKRTDNKIPEKLISRD
ncbi:uncharacterized protein LOC134687277 [Mytilus trossulus]|uniref:uncharacterized protein LOC134687277 n=1 Tax=Mytilus trossulus TaxID=6551 RepID=UPI00300446B7